MKTILVVEHDVDILEMLDFALQDAGYRTQIFKHENLVFDFVIKAQPDAILLDVIKPSEAGTLLCRQIARHPKTKHIPIVVLSTHQKMSVVKDLCADELIAKPFDIDMLLEVVEEQLNNTTKA